jgi:3-oxoacyl-[acyl-carrier-protein] synthase-3
LSSPEKKTGRAGEASNRAAITPYITGVGAFLPNAPVDNDGIETVLGPLNGTPSRIKKRILRNNGIRTRYYAVEPGTGRPTHTNARMTAEAVRALARETGFDLASLDLLACGTSTPDQWIPGHGPMVHGELGCPPCEVISTAGVCAAGMTALKYACASIVSGYARTSIATGSELASSLLRAQHFETNGRARGGAGAAGAYPAHAAHDATPAGMDPEASPLVAFDQEFLRWMLSDGAGAVLVEPQPRADRLSLRVDWIEVVSLANMLEPCMYWGASKQEDGSLVGWRDAGSVPEAMRAGLFNLTQDIKLLGKEISVRLVNGIFPKIRAKHGLAPGEVTWFLPHYSSEVFRQELYDRFLEIDFPIPFETWFTNLAEKGNTGSASIFIILEEFIRSNRIAPGDTILCLVPESARFSVAYALLTAVGPEAAETKGPSGPVRPHR